MRNPYRKPLGDHPFFTALGQKVYEQHLQYEALTVSQTWLMTPENTPYICVDFWAAKLAPWLSAPLHEISGTPAMNDEIKHNLHFDQEVLT